MTTPTHILVLLRLEHREYLLRHYTAPSVEHGK